MGVAFCLLFTWWFVSGFFMLYCGFPVVWDADRLHHAPPLDLSRARLSPEQAYKAIGLDIPPDQVRLAMFDGRPAYEFGSSSEQTIVYADDGTIQDGYPAALNLRTAAAWAGQPADKAHLEELSEPDQWTIGGEFAGERPIPKYSFPDGQDVYVSRNSGQVLQYTTTASRIEGYLGPVAHWLYFRPLRKNVKLWSRIVIWSSGIGTIMALSGLLVGVLVYSPSKRYRLNGQPTGIPYSGAKRLHTIFGLFFGIVTCTWAFSGMLSMEPFPAYSFARSQDPAEGRIARALRSPEIDLAAFSDKTPATALAAAPSNLSVKQLEFVSFGGDPVYIAHGFINGHNAPATWIIPIHGAPQEMFASEHVIDAIKKGLAKSGAESIADVRTVSRYEAYYSDHTGNLHGQRPLPALFVRLSLQGNTGRGNTGQGEAGFYIDPRTASIVGHRSTQGWFNRWLYHGLHSLDFPWLYNQRPLWDIVILLLLAGGTALCVTSAIIGWNMLQRKFTL